MSQNLDRPTDETLKSPLPIPKDYPEPDALKECPLHLWAVWLAQDVVLYSREPRPNLVRRFFLWAFFGWRWVPLKRDVETTPGVRAVSQDEFDKATK